MDDYGLDMARRRRAHLQAQIDVLDAQQVLRWHYVMERDEIDAFLASVEEAKEEGSPE